MHGHGYVPPQPPRPSTGVLVALRALFVALALLSCGLLSWATMLRIAIMRRRRLDWVLFWVSLGLVITVMVVLGEYGSDSELAATENDDLRPVDVVFVIVLFGMAIGVPTHYLVADIRHYQEPAAGWRPPQAGSPYSAVTSPSAPYGIPQRPAGYGYPPVPHQAQPQPTPQPTAPPTPAPTPPPAPPQRDNRPRIDQVRAELDELSDYLRREQDGGR
ncbi:hypothetical protein [Streptomyces sp. NPDC058572]|uniref:hypothetical protein n=1 Tax=Streptomyces sp. NPDC058572 TaxID=3346546 RepID=UPI00365D5EAB